jgi:homeodomain-containing protein
MPWKECSVMDERLQFVARRLAGEPMAEFGISGKTGYKIFDRYQECGVQGLTDRSRRPYRYANQLPFQVENYILNVKREHTSWGARKIRERLARRFSAIKLPAKAPSMRCWIVMAWWSAAVARVVVLREPLYRSASIPMNCGARITRASSCWGIVNTAIR